MKMFQVAVGIKPSEQDVYEPVVQLLTARGPEEALRTFLFNQGKYIGQRPWAHLPLVSPWPGDTPPMVAELFESGFLAARRSGRPLNMTGRRWLLGWLTGGLDGLYDEIEITRSQDALDLSEASSMLQALSDALYEDRPPQRSQGPRCIGEGTGVYLVARRCIRHSPSKLHGRTLHALRADGPDEAIEIVEATGQGISFGDYHIGPAAAPLIPDALPADLKKVFTALGLTSERFEGSQIFDLFVLAPWLDWGAFGLKAVLSNPVILGFLAATLKSGNPRHVDFRPSFRRSGLGRTLIDLTIKADAQGQFLWGAPYTPPQKRFALLEDIQASLER